MAPPHISLPPAAEPIRKSFDPWNSSATGHQRAENNCLTGSTDWRRSRTLKLASQYEPGSSGGKRVCDTVGVRSGDFGRDGRCGNGGWEAGAAGLREKGWQDVRALLSGSQPGQCQGPEEQGRGKHNPVVFNMKAEADPVHDQKPSQSRKIFQNLLFYINGSTAPMVSDLQLKRLLAEHGAGISIALGRRSVTHVILGTPNGAGRGAGGGLAAGKIQKEIKRVGGCGVKYVGVEW